jgi:hypothetical protein
MRTARVAVLQRGHARSESATPSRRDTLTPQCEQNFAPTKIIP